MPQPFLPFSAVLRNTGAKTIVLYTVRIEYDNGGHLSVITQVRDYRTSEPKLRSGDAHLTTPGAAITQAIATGKLLKDFSTAPYRSSFDVLARLQRLLRFNSRAYAQTL